MIAARCPQCSAAMLVHPEDGGHEVECPTCLTRFAAPRAAPQPEPERPPSARRRSWDDEDDRPRRRRRRPRASDPLTEHELEDARDKARGPALGLAIVGWLGFTLHFLGGVVAIVTGAVILNQPPRPGQPNADGVPAIIIGCVAAFNGLFLCLPMAIGGQRLLKVDTLSSLAWPYIGAIAGVAWAVSCHPCHPLTWAAVGMGIWALVALNGREVKRVVEANRYQGTGRGFDDDFDDRD